MAPPRVDPVRCARYDTPPLYGAGGTVWIARRSSRKSNCFRLLTIMFMAQFWMSTWRHDKHVSKYSAWEHQFSDDIQENVQVYLHSDYCPLSVHQWPVLSSAHHLSLCVSVLTVFTNVMDICSAVRMTLGFINQGRKFISVCLCYKFYRFVCLLVLFCQIK